MNRKSITCALLLAAATAASPASATVLLSGTNTVPFSPFVAATQGMLLASNTVSGIAKTFAGTTHLAVYRNTSGTLDFYYQFQRTGKVHSAYTLRVLSTTVDLS